MQGENANKIDYYTSKAMVVSYTCNKILCIPSLEYHGIKNQILMLIDQIFSSFANEKRNDVIGAFNLTSRYLDDLLNIDNIHFEQNTSINNETVSTKIYDKRDESDFDIVNFPFLDGDVHRRPSYGVYTRVSQK